MTMKPPVILRSEGKHGVYFRPEKTLRENQSSNLEFSPTQFALALQDP
jgi:hypothetical protein